MTAARAVTFDFGQTLAELDTGMLADRLLEREIRVPRADLDAAVAPAWKAYNNAIRAGQGGHPWKVLMRTLLSESGVPDVSLAPTVDWLWTEQPARNLWRRPIPGMMDLVRELRAADVPVGVVSNSEGRLAELASELGWAQDLCVIVDSGRLGIEKPDPRIFHHAADRMGVATDSMVHVGDAWSADFEGALGAGMRAVLFRGEASMPAGATLPSPDRGRRCDQPAEVRDVFVAWGLLRGSAR